MLKLYNSIVFNGTQHPVDLLPNDCWNIAREGRVHVKKISNSIQIPLDQPLSVRKSLAPTNDGISFLNIERVFTFDMPPVNVNADIFIVSRQYAQLARQAQLHVDFVDRLFEIVSGKFNDARFAVGFVKVVPPGTPSYYAQAITQGYCPSLVAVQHSLLQYPQDMYSNIIQQYVFNRVNQSQIA